MMAAATSSSVVLRLPWGILRVLATPPCGRGRLLGCNRLTCVPGTESLVHHFNGNAECFVDTRGKRLGFLRHLARGAIQTQRQSHYDATHAFLPHQLTQPGKIAPPIDPAPGRKWPRGRAVLVGQRQTEPLPAIVDCEDHTPGHSFNDRGRIGQRISHEPIITRKRDPAREARGKRVQRFVGATRRGGWFTKNFRASPSLFSG